MVATRDYKDVIIMNYRYQGSRVLRLRGTPVGWRGSPHTSRRSVNGRPDGRNGGRRDGIH